jgi:replicative DNA helicase
MVVHRLFANCHHCHQAGVSSTSTPAMAVDTQAPPASAKAPALQGAATTAADDVTRALPHAVGPEKSLLSSMLQDPQEWIGVAIEEKLTKDHFYLPAHQTLFGFLIELFEAGHEIELVSLVQRLLDRGLLDRVGGPAAITDLTSATTSST